MQLARPAGVEWEERAARARLHAEETRLQKVMVDVPVPNVPRGRNALMDAWADRSSVQNRWYRAVEGVLWDGQTSTFKDAKAKVRDWQRESARQKKREQEQQQRNHHQQQRAARHLANRLGRNASDMLKGADPPA